MIPSFSAVYLRLIRQFTWIMAPRLNNLQSRITEMCRAYVFIQYTRLNCATAFGTSDAFADIFHIHTTIAANCFHMAMNFE
jgi:hypothetical protein